MRFMQAKGKTNIPCSKRARETSSASVDAILKQRQYVQSHESGTLLVTHLIEGGRLSRQRKSKSVVAV